MFGVDNYRSYCLAPRLVTKGGSLASCKTDRAGWLRGLFIVHRGVGFPSRLLQVVGQSFIFIYGLIIICLHIQALRFIRKQQNLISFIECSFLIYQNNIKSGNNLINSIH